MIFEPTAEINPIAGDGSSTFTFPIVGRDGLMVPALDPVRRRPGARHAIPRA
jgi:hypothetical protein